MKSLSFFLFLLLSVALHAKPTVCLNMIVKDESAVITRCLDSVRPLIDYWVIVDTGSSDGTQDLIKEHMKDIPGELHERPWKNFGHNRTEALELAKNKSDYILFMDADDWLEYEKDYQLPSLTKNIYHMWQTTTGFSFLIPQLIKASLPCRWIGVTHEYLEYETSRSSAILEGVRYVLGDNGARSKDPQKFWKNVALLEEGLKEEPNNCRYVFYLAESYRDAGCPEKAIECYQRRLDMGGWQEEVFWSLLQIAKLQEVQNASFDLIVESYHRAHRFRPYRPEPIYYLAALYNHHHRADLAYECIKARDFVSKPPVKDVLFNEDWTEEWGLSFQLSIASFYLGHYQESIDLCKQLLALNTLPPNIRQQVITNQTFPLQKLYEPFSFKPEPYEEPDETLKADLCNRTVLLAILARDKAHVLPFFLNCIENLNYDKKLITIYINTNNNVDNTKELLEEWTNKNHTSYRKILFDHHELESLNSTNPHEWTSERFHVLGNIRNKSLKMTTEENCDYYFVVDCDNFIAPETLKELIYRDKPIIAPMLRSIPYPSDPYSNFFYAINEKGYYNTHPNYFKILNKKTVGTFKVPVVHTTYLIQSKYIEKLNYVDETQDHEFVIFSRSARNHQIDQYICNEGDFGVILNFYSHVDLDQFTLEQEKQYFLDFLTIQKWLSQSGLLNSSSL